MDNKKDKVECKDQCCSENLLSCNCASCQKARFDKEQTGKDKVKFMDTYGKDIYKIIFSIVFLVLGLCFKSNKVAYITFSMIAYIAIAFDVAVAYVKGLGCGNIFNELALMLLASITSLALGEFMEGVLIMLLYTIGEMLEDIATSNSRKKIAGLSEIKSYLTHLVDKDGMYDVDPKDVKVGSMLEVRNGERVPCDCVLVGASATLDVRAITGESKLSNIGFNDNIYSGSINVGDPIYVKTTKLYEDSTVEQIIKTVEGALAKKAKSQKFITSFAKIYTPVVGVVAILIAVLVPLIDGMNFYKWIYKALSFLVVSCPCALVISVPLAYFVGIGSLAKTGVMVKGSKSIDMLAKAKIAVFDKTGTLTKGNFVVENVDINGDFDSEYIMQLVSALESKSNHPIAKAIVSYCGKSKFTAENIKEITGVGLTGKVDNREIAVGNHKILDIDSVENSDKTSFYILVDKKYAGEISLADEIKEESFDLIRHLKKLGIKKTVMLSGDRKTIAEEVGEKLGIDKVYAELLPDEKFKILEELKKEDKVIYVGDGVNDSPTLALADVGVSMGGLGSDIAVSSSDVVIMDDKIDKLSKSVRFSRKIRNTVLQNIVFSLGIKLAIMILSLFINMPVFIAMFGDVGCMLLAVLNSLKNTKVKQMK